MKVVKFTLLVDFELREQFQEGLLCWNLFCRLVCTLLYSLFPINNRIVMQKYDKPLPGVQQELHEIGSKY